MILVLTAALPFPGIWVLLGPASSCLCKCLSVQVLVPASYKAEAQANLGKSQCIISSGLVAQVVKEGGAYANGQVVVQPLPTAIYGEDAQRTVPLRRLEAVLTEEQLDFQCELEMQKVQLLLLHVVVTLLFLLSSIVTHHMYSQVHACMCYLSVLV